MKQTMTRARLLASGLLGGGALLAGPDLAKAVEAVKVPVASIVDEIPPASLRPRFAPGHWAPSGTSPQGWSVVALTWFDKHGLEQGWRHALGDDSVAEMAAIEQLILQHGGSYTYGGEAIGYDGKLLTKPRP